MCDKSMNKIILIIVVSIFYTLSSASELNYTAELMEGFKDRYGNGRKLIDSVTLWQDDITIKCDYAVYHPARKRAELEGNVRIFQDSLIIFSDKVIYYSDRKFAESPGKIKIVDQETILKGNKGTYNTIEKKAIFKGDVSIDDDTSRIYCDHLVHYRTDEVSFTYGDVFLWAKNENVYLSADTIENYGSAKLTYAYSKPELFLIDSTFSGSSSFSRTFTLDTMTVKAERMEAQRIPNDQVFYFFDSVEVFRKDVQSKADSIIFYAEKDLTNLTGEPVIFYGESQLFGDSISISMKNNELDKIKAVNNSFSISIEDTLFNDRKNQISGDTITIDFEKNQASGIFSIGNSKMLYFMFNEEKSPDGANVFSSEGLEILFVDNEASDVNLFKGKAGGQSPEGQTLPEFMTYGRIEELNLPKFKWDKTRPRMLKLKYLEKKD
jgi:lipopolysaccharide export system protein LptA